MRSWTLWYCRTWQTFNLNLSQTCISGWLPLSTKRRFHFWLNKWRQTGVYRLVKRVIPLPIPHGNLNWAQSNLILILTNKCHEQLPLSAKMRTYLTSRDKEVSTSWWRGRFLSQYYMATWNGHYQISSLSSPTNVMGRWDCTPHEPGITDWWTVSLDYKLMNQNGIRSPSLWEMNIEWHMIKFTNFAEANKRRQHVLDVKSMSEASRRNYR